MKKLRKKDTSDDSQKSLSMGSRPPRKPAFLNDIKKMKRKQKKHFKNRDLENVKGTRGGLHNKNVHLPGTKVENLSDIRKRPKMPFLKDITERTSKKAKKKKLTVRNSTLPGDSNTSEKSNGGFDKLKWLKKTPKKKGSNPATMMAEIQKKREKLRSRKKPRRQNPSSDETTKPKSELERAMERLKPVKDIKSDKDKGKNDTVSKTLN